MFCPDEHDFTKSDDHQSPRQIIKRWPWTSLRSVAVELFQSGATVLLELTCHINPLLWHGWNHYTAAVVSSYSVDHINIHYRRYFSFYLSVFLNVVLEGDILSGAPPPSLNRLLLAAWSRFPPRFMTGSRSSFKMRVNANEPQQHPEAFPTQQVYRKRRCNEMETSTLISHYTPYMAL